MEKKIRLTIILVLILIVLGAYSWRAGQKRENLVFNQVLDQVVVTVDENNLTLEDLAFYVAYEEKTVQESAVVYDPENPNLYWNIHTDGQFIKVAAKQAVIDMAVHDEIFYQMACKEKVELDEDETVYYKNEVVDFCADLTQEQFSALGIDEETVDAAMYKIAVANKYQEAYAGIAEKIFEDYNFQAESYLELLATHTVRQNDEVWDRIEFGNITLNNY